VLAGVRAPAPSKKGGEDVSDSTGQSEDFGDEARWFVESKLLQRQVKIELMYKYSFWNYLTTVVLTKPGVCLLLRLNIPQAILLSFWFSMALLDVPIGCPLSSAGKGCRNFERLKGGKLSDVVNIGKPRRARSTSGGDMSARHLKRFRLSMPWFSESSMATQLK
jgi:hypothetical protein